MYHMFQDLNFENQTDHAGLNYKIQENTDKNAPISPTQIDYVNKTKTQSDNKNIVTSELFNSSFESPSHSLKRGSINHLTISEQDSDSATLTREDQKVWNQLVLATQGDFHLYFLGI